MRRTNIAVLLIIVGMIVGFASSVFIFANGIFDLIEYKVVCGVLKVVFCGFGFVTLLPFYIVANILIEKGD